MSGCADFVRWQHEQLLLAMKAVAEERREEIARLKARITEHNVDCTSACQARCDRGHCDDYIDRGRSCPDCPKEWAIVETEEVSDE